MVSVCSCFLLVNSRATPEQTIEEYHPTYFSYQHNINSYYKKNKSIFGKKRENASNT